jgi:murein L,D-transpeptidase YcbB/YkuD
MRTGFLAQTLFITASLLLAPVCSSAAEKSAAPEVNRDIEALLNTKSLVIDGVEILTRPILLEVYADHGFEPYWTKHSHVQELMDLIDQSADHGLDPADYNALLLHRLVLQQSRSPSAQLEAKEEILLMESLLRYGYHRRFGKVKASSLDPDINFRRELFHDQPPSVTIEQALGASSLADFIQMVAADGPVYRHLQDALDRYRDIAEAGGWLAVTAGPTLRKGDQDARVAAIRQRLTVTGDLPAGTGTTSRDFDRDVERAVVFFQARHSLDDDGIVGKQTLEALNVPAKVRVNQLRLSLERLRWVNQEAVDTLVAVNIAGFRVFFYKDGQLEWSTRAMVGKHYRKTPVFRGDIAYLEFNPTWTIPPGILRNDTLPSIKKDPNYLASKNIRVIDRNGKFVDPSTVNWSQYSKGVPYTLRQEPGPKNSLGTVKFIFPNEHFVFLHDTPHRELFAHSERAFSSGCIRVENPLKLAELVLDQPDKYPRSELEQIVASRKTQRIHPSPKVPVVIVYLTASVDSDGAVRFYKDIYDRDQKVLDALNGPVIVKVPGWE